MPRANLPSEDQQLACFKIVKTQRHQYSMFDVGRSTFNILKIPIS